MRPVFRSSRTSHYAPDTLEPARYWAAEAACRGSDVPDLWFAEGSSPQETADRNEAKRVCRRCPVQEPCLTAALERGERDGVWGGLTYEERHQLIPYRRPARTAAVSEEEWDCGPPPGEHAASA